MHTLQGSMLETLRATEVFLDDHVAKLPGIEKTGARQRLKAAIVELDGHAAEQTGNEIAAKGATQQTDALRVALLHDHMTPIARIAKADLPRTPALSALRMPKGKPTVERLAAAAEGMAKEASVHADVFISAGMPKEFIAQLDGAVAAMLGSRTKRTQSRGKRGGATMGLKEKLAGARKTLAVLDAFVSTALKNDPVLLSSWKIVKRVHKYTSPTLTETDDSAATTPAPVLPPTPTPAPVLTPVAHAAPLLSPGIHPAVTLTPATSPAQIAAPSAAPAPAHAAL